MALGRPRATRTATKATNPMQVQHTGYIQRKSNPNLGRDEVRQKQTDSILATRLHPKIPHPNLHPYALITIQIHEIYSTLGKGIEYTPSAALRDGEARVRRSNRHSADEIASALFLGRTSPGRASRGRRQKGNETLRNGQARFSI